MTVTVDGDIISISVCWFLLGNDLPGDTVHISPVVIDYPVVGQENKGLAEEFPGIFPACVVTSAKAGEAKHELGKREDMTDFGVILAETFFEDLDKEIEAPKDDGKRVLCYAALVSQQRFITQCWGTQDTLHFWSLRLVVSWGLLPKIWWFDEEVV